MNDLNVEKKLNLLGNCFKNNNVNYMSHPIFFKWSPSVNDPVYEKSKLEDKHKSIGNNVMEAILQEGPSFINNERGDGLSNWVGNGTINGTSNETKRENNFERMNQREMVAQTNKNPFLSSNYLEDLQVQEDFLTPQNSNIHDASNSQENTYLPDDSKSQENSYSQQNYSNM